VGTHIRSAHGTAGPANDERPPFLAVVDQP